jgi:methanethiol S-methyltransferase
MNTQIISKKSNPIAKAMITLYGIVCYLVFFPTFCYFIAFTGGILVPKTVDTGVDTPLAEAVLINIGLIMLFGLQHSIMARQRFKQHIAKVIPTSMERSTFVLVSALLLALIAWQWRPITVTIWEAKTQAGQIAMYTLYALGWSILLLSTFLIDHFELFGLKQVFKQFRESTLANPRFRTPWFYKMARHPMMTGFFIGLWATPHMTMGHLILATGFTIYILIGVHYEEKDLIKTFGEKYIAYKKEIPKFIPGLKNRSKVMRHPVVR